MTHDRRADTKLDQAASGGSAPTGVAEREPDTTGNGTIGAAAAVAAEPVAARPRPTCSVVIPVHNKASLTRQCLNHLLAQRDDRFERELIVVDDGSTDLTQRLLAAYADRVRVLTHARAKGFSGACNAGAEAATGDYILFLNNDTVPRPNWLSALIRHAEEHPRAAVVGAKLLFPNDTIQHAGVVFGGDRYPRHVYVGFPGNHPATNTSRRFQAVTGACFLVRRGPWQEMGGFDPSFVNGWEDVDLCLRFGAAGYEIHYCHESVIVHLESSSRDIRAQQEQENRDRYAERWLDRVEPDDLSYYVADGLITFTYGAHYPIKVSVSPLLAGLSAGEADRASDRLLAKRAHQAAILLRNNIILNTRVQEAELRAQMAELRVREAELRLAAAGGVATADAATSAPAEASTAAPPAERRFARIVGNVEEPGRDAKVVTEESFPVSGWALSAAGIWKIETIVDGEPYGQIAYGQPRPDVAAVHPGLPDGEQCGFAGTVPVVGLADGPHTLIIRIIAKDGHHVEVSTDFEVDSSSWIMLVRCNLPRPGRRNLAHDRLPVVGWALARAGIRSVETFVDDEPLGHVSYGAPRPDVAKDHPTYPDAERSGFTGSVPLAGLVDGEHRLRIHVTDFDERHRDLEVTFEVDSTATAVGEVPHVNLQYPTWRREHTPTADDLERARAAATALAERPLISLVVPLGGAPAAVVDSLVDSVQAQVYDNWQLCLAAVTGADVLALVQRLAADDARITVVTLPQQATVAAAVNGALAEAGGEWVVVVPPHDLLSPLALFEVARTLNERPETDIVYVDEDKIDTAGDIRWDPFFKPDWSPDLHLSTDYLGPFTLYRRSLLTAIGGYRPGFTGSEAYDLALRATERCPQGAERIAHVPRLLYSRRASSVAGTAASEGAQVESGRRALTEALARRGRPAAAERGITLGRWRVRYELPEVAPVTIVMPTDGQLEVLRPSLDDILARSTYPDLRLLLLDHSGGTAVAELCDELAATRPNLIRREAIAGDPVNRAALINQGLSLVETPYLILLEDDLTVITPDWIEAMLEHAQRPEVGVVGGKLLFPDKTIQQAGLVLGPYDAVGHAFKRFSADYTGYFGLPNVIRNASAVGFACAMLRRSIVDEVGGLDAEHLPTAFHDVDLCLRIAEAGYRVVYTPHAQLYHQATPRTAVQPSEVQYLRSRWGHVIDHDPFYNPNLTRRAEDFSLKLD